MACSRYVVASLAGAAAFLFCLGLIAVPIVLLALDLPTRATARQLSNVPIGSHVKLERVGHTTSLVLSDGLCLVPTSEQEVGGAYGDLTVTHVAAALHSAMLAGIVQPTGDPSGVQDPYFLVAVGGVPVPGTEYDHVWKSHDGQTIHIYVFSSLKDLKSAWHSLTHEPMPIMKNLLR